MQARSQLDVGFAGHARLFYVGQEELAQGSGGQAAFDIGIVKIGAGEISELLGGIFILAAGEGRGIARGIRSFGD